MNIQNKKNELILLLNSYLSDRSSVEDLQLFVGEIIDYFTDNKKNNLPPYQDFEKEFWYAIWQIQHLADIEHENERGRERAMAFG